MTTFTIVFKALRFLWPFIAEMFFAGKSLKQIVMENKLVVFLLTLLFCSIFLNYLSISKIYEIAIARREEEPYVVRKNQSSDKPEPTEPYPPKKSGGNAPDHRTEVQNRLKEIYGEP